MKNFNQSIDQPQERIPLGSKAMLPILMAPLPGHVQRIHRSNRHVGQRRLYRRRRRFSSISGRRRFQQHRFRQRGRTAQQTVDGVEEGAVRCGGHVEKARRRVNAAYNSRAQAFHWKKGILGGRFHDSDCFKGQKISFSSTVFFNLYLFHNTVTVYLRYTVN